MIVPDKRKVSFAKGTVSALTGQKIEKDDDSDWSSSSAPLDDSMSQSSSQADQSPLLQSPTPLSSLSAGTLTPSGGGGNELDDLLAAALNNFPDPIADIPHIEEEKFVLAYQESEPSSTSKSAEPIPDLLPVPRPAPGRRGSVLDILNRQTHVPVTLDTAALPQIAESETSEAFSIPQSESISKTSEHRVSFERVPKRQTVSRKTKQLFGRNVK